jgi:G3E family GTPase
VTKGDLAGPDAVERLVSHVRALTSAPLGYAVDGAIEPGFLLEEPPAAPRKIGPGEARHTHGLETFALSFEAPLSWPAFDQAMAVLMALRGPDLLRVKGLVAVEGCRGPVVVHYVQHVAHPPVELEEWPDADRRSRLVFVTRGLARAAVTRLFSGIAAIAAASG